MPQPALQAIEQRPSERRDTEFARRLRGFGPVGIVAALLVIAANVFAPFIVIRAFAVVLWAWLSRTPWSAIGFVRPKSWARTIFGGIVMGAAFKLLMKAVVMPLLGAPPINAAYHFLAHNTAAVPAMLFTVIVGAGFGEEAFYRGFAFERLGRLFGNSAIAKAAMVLITSALFGAAHYAQQGLAGAEQAFIVGAVFATVFATTGRLFGLMIAHAAFDLTALAIIYWDVETRVAHWFFR